MVLTGDNLIRKWCIKKELEVHGVLWVLEQFTKKDLLDATQHPNYLIKLIEAS